MADIDIGKISEALNNKTDRNMRNVDTSVSDALIAWQAPTAENGYTWYRKYASGWVEQGGTLPAQATVTATLPIEMSDNNYQVLLTGGLFATTAGDIRVKYVQTRTTTSFTASANSAIPYMWQVSGVSA